MAKDEKSKPADPVADARQERHALDQAVAAAQRSVAAAPRAESQEARDRRIAADREAVDERNAAVQAAQEAELAPAKAESQADRDARIASDRQAVLDRQDAVRDAVHDENVRQAKALGLDATSIPR